MNQKNIGNFIKKIRLKNKLTQKQFANLLGVTYQAVSKWENGINIPDILILQEISKKFNVDISDLINGKETKKVVNIKYFLLIIGIIFAFLIGIIILVLNNKSSYEFKSLTSDNKDFTINGVVAYSTDKNSLYISNINYNGRQDNSEYKVLECTLYEKNGNTETKISKCGDISKIKTINKTATLSNLLKKITFNINDYSHKCKNLSKNDLYLQVNALDNDNKTISYKIPLKLKDECNKN